MLVAMVQLDKGPGFIELKLLNQLIVCQGSHGALSFLCEVGLVS